MGTCVLARDASLVYRLVQLFLPSRELAAQDILHFLRELIEDLYQQQHNNRG
jgi:hypothetical protein